MDRNTLSVLHFDDYQLIFNLIDEGICTIEKVDAKPDEPIDFRYIHTNPAFEKVTGLIGIVGKTMREVLPDISDNIMQVYDNVIKTGQPVRFESYEKSLDLWFSAYAFPIGEVEQKRIAVIFNDISVIKRLQLTLRENYACKEFLLKLSDAIRSISDPAQIQMTACRVLGEYIGASRVLYGDVINEKEVVISHDYADGVLSLAAHLNIKDFSQFTVDTYISGKPVVIHNIYTDTRLTEDKRNAFKSIQAAANIGLGLVKNGKWAAVFGVHQSQPRNWTPLEIYLIQETAERTWAAVERAKAEAEKERLLTQVFDERERLRAVIRSIDDELWITDAKGYITLMNPAAQRAQGLPAGKKSISEIVDLLEIMEPDGSPRPRENAPLLRSLKGETVCGEEIIRHFTTGEPRYRQFNCAPIRDQLGNIAGSVAVSRDITEAKRAEREMKESEARALKVIETERRRLYDMFDRLPAMICLITTDYHVAFANQAFRERFGESHGRHCYEYCMGKLDSPCEFCEAFQVFKTLKPHHWEIATPDGSVLDIYDHPFTDADGSPLVLEMALDITQRKQAEKGLRESEYRATELVRELEEADKNKNHYISVLSHELRNPLAAISVGLSVLEVSGDEQQIESAKEIMKRQVNQLCKLVDDLLDLTRITQNRIKLRKEIILLNEIVRDAVKDIKPEFAKKGVKIWEKELDRAIILSADPIRISQCVGNLLRNALKFTPEKGNVWVSLKQEKGEAVLSVEDDGIGINPEILAELFTPFTQADASLDRYDNNGLGLGLSIVKGNIEMHGGSVSAASDGLGKGASFTIRLPVSTEIDEMQRHAAVPKAGRAIRILFIEDNKDLAELLSSAVSMLGHEVYAAYDGLEGIAKARDMQPDVIFCDIGLPGKSGYKVAKTIREDGKLKSTYLVALTGYASEYDIEHAKESGFDRHLAKPVNAGDIEIVLSEALSRQ